MQTLRTPVILLSEMEKSECWKSIKPIQYPPYVHMCRQTLAYVRMGTLS